MPHYLIKPKKNGSDKPAIQPRIVEAKNQARALAFVIEDTLEVKLAEPADLIAHGKAGREIEKAQ